MAEWRVPVGHGKILTKGAHFPGRGKSKQVRGGFFKPPASSAQRFRFRWTRSAPRNDRATQRVLCPGLVARVTVLVVPDPKVRSESKSEATTDGSTLNGCNDRQPLLEQRKRVVIGMRYGPS
jgi:hypothetical protein